MKTHPSRSPIGTQIDTSRFELFLNVFVRARQPQTRRRTHRKS